MKITDSSLNTILQIILLS